MGGVARAIPTAIKGMKMMDSGSSEQEARSYMESQGLRNIEFTKNKPTSETSETETPSETKRLLRAKRKGRSSTVLSSSSGVEGEASVSKKTLLGG
jgi:hypothetical protein